MTSSMQAPTIGKPASTQLMPMADLAEATRDHAAELAAAVAAEYLVFRQDFYHEYTPDLARPPFPHAEIRQGELAGVARSVLRLVPQAVHSIPLLGGFLEHLEQVADMHSISEQERAELHNMTMLFLHGLQDGIQPWYIEWLLASARNLAQLDGIDYYLDHPWDALLYHSPAALRRFEVAVPATDRAVLESEIERLAAGLIKALHDPIGMHAELAFTGPRADREKLVFQLKTTAALALGAYLIVEQVQQQLHPRRPAQSLHSRLAPVPDEMDTAVLTNSR
ncbi:MAG TPA: hypothetical protein VGS80_20250 [Ktedonobacterales bacterium]|nr:hypothetical protein [Ktedonobacterales bacterium]